MNWREQEREVDRLAAMAQADADAMTSHRMALRGWSRRTLGNTNGLAWSFAAGVATGLVRGSGESSSKVRSRAIAAANASLFAWRVASAQTP